MIIRPVQLGICIRLMQDSCQGRQWAHLQSRSSQHRSSSAWYWVTWRLCRFWCPSRLQSRALVWVETPLGTRRQHPAVSPEVCHPCRDQSRTASQTRLGAWCFWEQWCCLDLLGRSHLHAGEEWEEQDEFKKTDLACTNLENTPTVSKSSYFRLLLLQTMHVILIVL